MTSRIRAWTFTLNNYTDDDLKNLGLLGVAQSTTYLIYGKEIGENNTPHLQGYIYMKAGRTFSAMKKIIPKAHIEASEGSAASNTKYCSKDGDVTTFGAPPSQGKRNDIQEIKDMVRRGETMAKIVEVAANYQSVRMAEVCMKYKPLEKREKPMVKWYYGGTGTGKTYAAWEETGYIDTWVSHDSLQWFDGYDGQKNVIIDDFRAGDCRFSNLLRYLDRYPMKVPIKGGFVNWVPTLIIITSTHQPKKVYKNIDIQENIDQLLRRIDIIQKYNWSPPKST